MSPLRPLTIILTSLLFVVAVSMNATAGTVTFLPMKPVNNGKLTIEYRPDAGMAAHLEEYDNDVHAVVYWFTAENDLPRAADVVLTRDGERWKASTTVPSDVAVAMIKVGAHSTYDTNKDRFWSIKIFDASGKAVRGAHMREAYTNLGNLPVQCRRTQDIDEAVTLLRQETLLHKDNVSAQIALAQMELKAGIITQDEAVSRISDVVHTPRQKVTEADAVATAQGLQIVGKTSDARQLMKDFAEKDPTGRAAQQLALETLQQATTAQAFISVAIDFLGKYPNSPSRQNILDAALQAGTQGGELKALVASIDKVASLPPMAYYQIANYAGANDSLRAKAITFVDRGLRGVVDASQRDSTYGEREWKRTQRRWTSQLKFVRGAVLRAMGKETEALTDLRSAINDAGEEADGGAYELLVGMLQTKDPSEAQKIATAAIESGHSTQGVVTAWRAMRRDAGKDSVTVEKELTSLRERGRRKSMEKFRTEMMNMPLIDGTFVDLDGKPSKISDWKGKVVIVDYWATWCGPCRMSFPSLQKLYEKYRNNPNVVFAIVNVWERGGERKKLVTDFLKNNPTLTFPMYIDEKDDVVKNYGVTGIPTKFFLGKDGRIQFKEVGVLPEEQFIDEASMKIDLLLAQ